VVTILGFFDLPVFFCKQRFAFTWGFLSLYQILLTAVCLWYAHRLIKSIHDKKVVEEPQHVILLDEDQERMEHISILTHQEGLRAQ
jgi:hypothetical protein